MNKQKHCCTDSYVNLSLAADDLVLHDRGYLIIDEIQRHIDKTDGQTVPLKLTCMPCGASCGLGLFWMSEHR